MLKILILNAGWSNKGTYALTQATMSIISKYIPDVEFTLMGTETMQDKIKIKQQLALKPLRSFDPWIHLIKAFLASFCMHKGISVPTALKSSIYDYINCDIVINSGGDHLSGEFNKFGLSSYMNILYAILLRKPVVLHGESLGFYSSDIYNFIARQILKNVNLILVRENISKLYIDSFIKHPNVYVTADPAFALEPSVDSRVDDILRMEEIEIDRPLIGMNPSGLISRYIEDERLDLDKIMANLADRLIENLNAKILLIPHVYSPDSDDRKAMDRVFNLVMNKQRINMIKNEYTSEDLKGIIGRCDLFIGARMHSTIASTSLFVPTIGIAYSHKMRGIIGEMLDQRKYVIGIEELNYETLERITFEAWGNRDRISDNLRMKIPFIKDQAWLNGWYIKKLVESLDL